jgi:ribonucleoside-triphosphate reductase
MGEYNIMLQIQKRNGTLVPFDRQKIINAVNKALIEVDGQLYEDDTAKDIAKEIEDAMYDLDEEKATAVSVEDIQDMVEDELMQSERRDVARAYIRYRYKQEVQREHEAVFIAPIREKLEARNIQNQNANVDEHSFGGRLGEAAEVMTKEYAFDYIISKKSRENHMNNEIYIHDAGSYAVGSHNCLSLPIDPLMEKGFNTRQTDVRPANSISTFFQLLAVLFQLQSLQQFGGVSATHLDWSAVPYVRKSFKKHLIEGFKYIARGDKYIKNLLASGKEISIIDSYIKENYPKTYEYAYDMTEKETKQAVEGMYHNLNTLQSRSGNQLPFTSINYGTCTLPEGRMVIKALLEGSLAGVGKIHKTSIFPCGIFQCMKGVNRKPGEPNYDLYRLALKSTAARLYPNYANCDWSGNAGYDPDDPTTYFSTMGCRTANGWDINGFGQKKDGRGNICPVTIILPTLAMEAKEKIDKEYELDIKCNPFSVTDEHYINAFMDLLDTKIHEAKDMLIERFNWICSQPADSAKFMYENGTMAGYIPEEGIRSALKHGTLAVGQLGLAEALQILIGTDHTTPEGMKLAKKIEQLFKDRCAEFKEKYKLNFGVYYTPAENLCYTALKKFRAKYGVIKDVSDKDFFTNSMHVPVWKEVSPFEKIDIECQLTGYSSAGCITYVELDGAVKNNLDALDEIVQYAMDHDIPYFAINVPNDTCLDCGYTGEFNDCCPICGSKNIQQLRRVTGYLTGNYKTAFNLGKQNEVNLRIKHIGRLEQ